MKTSQRRPVTLHDRYEIERGSIYLSGVQALVRLSIDVRRHDHRAGRDTRVFVSGYEGSPLAGFDLEMLKRRELMNLHDVRLEQGLNEELAANAVQGTQFAQASGRTNVDGIVGIWYGKAPGLDRATDAIRHSNLSGTHRGGGVIALVADDTVAKSSTVPSSSELALASLSIPTLVPADAQDILDLGLHALTLSRASGLWAGFKIATNVADGSCTADVSPDRIVPVMPELDFDGVPYTHEVSAHLLQPKLTELEFNLVHRRLVLAERYSRANNLNRTIARSDHDTVGIIAAGSTYLDVAQALRKLGLHDSLPEAGIRLMKIGMAWPLDAQTIREFAAGLKEIIVVEEKRSFLEAAVKDILYSMPDRPNVVGKTNNGVPLLRPDADLSPDIISAALAQRLLAHREHPSVRAFVDAGAARPRERALLPITPRTPFFCSGCPHNRSTQTPEGSLVGTGIGCHGMATFMAPERVGTVISLTQMGGEGAPWIGMAPYVDDNHLIQNLGDGTFHHSGSLAVRAAVAAGVNITYKLLHNSTVAMTGGQDVVGAMPVPALVASLYADGVRRVVVTTDQPGKYRRVKLPAGAEVRHRDDLIRTQEELARVPGVTVLIHDQECAAELRRKRKRGLVEAPVERAFINQRVCEGCGDCGAKSGCLSVQPVPTEFGRKTHVHQSSCNLDMSCLDGDCPAFIKVKPAGARLNRPRLPELASDVLTRPPGRLGPDGFAMRIMGIGGTGVVTVAQIIANAAVLDGYHVRALDQTGLAQKGGAVVSDLKLSKEARDVASKLSTEECDLYLGCDLLAAASAANLAPASPGRTAAVVSTTQTPTGAMVVDVAQRFPEPGPTLDRIRQRVASDVSVFVDAQALTRQLFGDDQFANIFLVGVATQAGLLPVSSESLEEAIALNGVAVDRNIQAFRRGRQHVDDPKGLQDALSPSGSAGPVAVRRDRVESLAAMVGAPDDSELRRLVHVRVGELIAYQNLRYARRYAVQVERVRQREALIRPDSTTLAEAVARNLYKLMAYKDEYEVARLSLQPDLARELYETFGMEAQFSYQLHPPLLRALGMRRKVSLGAWFRPVFVVLYALRRIRGSRLDLFGYARVRRTERALLRDYELALDRLLSGLNADNLQVAIELAEAPDAVRGYEDVKLRTVEPYRARVDELFTKFHSSESDDHTLASGGIS